MTSGKQRKAEIKDKRIKRAGNWQSRIAVDPRLPLSSRPCELWPDFYVDQPFTCRDCGAQEIWTALQQKWWFETAKGTVKSSDGRCRDCRAAEKARREEARRVSSI
jgi:hypothetical protein